MQQIMITGSNRGIGLALVREYVTRSETHIFATCRNPDSAQGLQALKASYPESLTLVALDINDNDSIARAYDIVSSKTTQLHLLINNAGVFPRQVEDTTLGQLSREALNHVVTTNSVSPLLVTQAFVDLLKQAMNPRVVMVSSQMGSIARAGAGSYGYRMSKASMNMASKILALNLADSGITVVTTHPGHVATDMGGSSAPVKPVQSATGLAKIADNLTPAQSGKFFNYTGEEIPW